MRNRLFLILSFSILLPACDRAVEEASRAAQQAEEQRAKEERLLAEERERLEREREAIEAEKEELRQMREAALAQREAELDEREVELLSESEDGRLRAEELAAQQEELELREQALSEQELEQAGTGVIEDWTVDEPAIVQEPVADYDLFYEELAPHGSWFDTPDYGYVYQPTVVIQNHSWRPYTRGRWVCTNLGWTWRSDEPFGWACFHYGRWALLAKRGWCWVPGSEWAPSWCAWRYGGGHVGWAPLPPETLAYRRSWGVTVGREFGIGHNWFNFVDTRHMAGPAYRHCLPIKRNRHYYDQTSGCTNLRYQGFQVIAGGPSYKLIKPLIHEPWPIHRLDLNRTGGFGRGHESYKLRKGRIQGDRLQVFAPSLDAPWNPGLRPKRVAESWKDVQVVRANALKENYQRRFAEVRKRQQETARELTKANEERRQQQQAKLERNREAVAAAQERYRENLQRQVSLQAKNGARPGNQGNGRVAGGRPSETSSRNQQPAPREDLPPGMSRPVPGQEPSISRRNEPQGNPVSETPVADRLADFRKKQEEARQRLAQQAEERRQVQQVNQRSSRPTPLASGGGSATVQEGPEATRLQREQATTRGNSGRQTQPRQNQQALLREQQENLRMQQERNRAAQEQAKLGQQQRLREQQEQARLAQEQAKQAAAQRARQQQEKTRQQQEVARQAAEERARQQQAASRQAAEERARKQAEMARQQEAARQAAQERIRQQQEQIRQQQEAARRASEERARQQQEAARRAAEQRARQQQEQQQKVREAQERMRQKIREAQERQKK